MSPDDHLRREAVKAAIVAPGVETPPSNICTLCPEPATMFPGLFFSKGDGTAAGTNRHVPMCRRCFSIVDGPSTAVRNIMRAEALEAYIASIVYEPFGVHDNQWWIKVGGKKVGSLVHQITGAWAASLDLDHPISRLSGHGATQREAILDAVKNGRAAIVEIERVAKLMRVP